MSDLTDFLLSSIGGAKKPADTAAAGSDGQPGRSDEQPLAGLKLKPAVQQALTQAGIHTVKQFLEMSGADFLVVPGIDVFAAAELKKIQARFQGQPSARVQEVSSPTPKGEATPGHNHAGLSIGDLDLPSAYLRALRKNGIRTLDALCGYTMEDLVAKFRLAAARAIARAVERKGFSLAPSVPNRTGSVASSLNDSSLATVAGPREPIATPASAPQPSGPGKWLNLAFATLSKTEAHMLVAMNGLDGKGIREVARASAEIGLDPHTGFRISLMAKARLRVVMSSGRLAELLALFTRVISENGRPCTIIELAVAVGYPDPGDGYDPLAFTRFVLPLCEGLRQTGPEHWDLLGKRHGVVETAAKALPEERPTTRSTPPITSDIKTVRLGDIRRMEARLVALVATLAAQEKCVVDIARLREFSEGAGVRLGTAASFDIELGKDGLWLEVGKPGELRLISSLRLVLTPDDLPGKLSDLAFLRVVLPKVGVLRMATGNNVEFPKVELAVEQPKPRRSPLSETQKAPETRYPTIRLASIAQKETRLAVLVASLAAERGSVVNARRLQQFADGAGIYYLSVRAILGALTQAGLAHEEPIPGHFRLIHRHRVQVAPSDLPGRLADLEFMRDVLPKVGVVSVTDGTASKPIVLVEKVDQ